jgi:hypothetical protein
MVREEKRSWLCKIEKILRFVVSHPVYLGSTKWTGGPDATFGPRVWDPCLQRCSVRLVSPGKEKVVCCTWSGRFPVCSCISSWSLISVNTECRISASAHSRCPQERLCHQRQQLTASSLTVQTVVWVTQLCTELTALSRVPSQKMKVSQLLRKFPSLYAIQRFITVFKTARHLSLSWARSIQSTPSYPVSIRYILILSSHISLSLPNGVFPSGFPHHHNLVCSSPTRAICPAHLNLLD